jgi:hypothetical protein
MYEITPDNSPCCPHTETTTDFKTPTPEGALEVIDESDFQIEAWQVLDLMITAID